MPLPNIDKWIRDPRRQPVRRTGPLHLPPTEEMIRRFLRSSTRGRTGNFFNIAEPTRLKVPSRALREVLSPAATVHWSPDDDSTFTVPVRDNSYFFCRLRKNGNVSHDPREARTITAPVVQASITSQIVLWEATLSTGDYLDLDVRWQVMSQTARDNISGLRLEAWLTLRRLGKPS